LKYLSFYIAKRYLFSKKSHNAINIISAISVVGVAIGTMGLIVVLSVFNGFSDLVISLYNQFDPDLKIVPASGKTFTPDERFNKIEKLSSVRYYAETLEETALLRYRERQYFATIKGVGKEYRAMTFLDDVIVDGDVRLDDQTASYGIPGSTIAYSLGLSIYDQFNPINIYVAKRGKVNALTPDAALNQKAAVASGVFAIQQDFDSKYLLLPLPFVRDLLNYENEATAVEIALHAGTNADKFKKEVQNILGEDFNVLTRLQQHDFLYKILRSEKLAVYIILTFILLIATFNVIGSLTMLIIDKKKDIAVLWSMGADAGLIHKIFLTEGMLITLFGAVIGLVLGAAIAFLQQEFGLVSIGETGSFIIDAYPVSMELMDFVLVFVTVSVIGFIAAWLPAQQLVKKHVYSTVELS
jgi:lipoprotein-releasing system permease protein